MSRSAEAPTLIQRISAHLATGATASLHSPYNLTCIVEK